jgi:putative methionine-R-sulfoxide reductase with GAF domain/ribosomal protein L37E
MAEQIVADQKEKPILDEQTLQRLLEAAFVLQEHNDGFEDQESETDQLRVQEFVAHSREKQTGDDLSSQDDYTLTLAQIVETQRQIQTRHLSFENAMALVAESIVEITQASGAAIAILDGKKVRYRAVSGACALRLDSVVAVDKAICSACLRTGHVVRSTDIDSEFLVDVEECRRRGIQSLIAVPVYHDGSATGALELYFGKTLAFTSQDVHTCQLMAGLVSEVFARDSELTWKKSLAAERANMPEALAKLKPNLMRLSEKESAKASNLGETGVRTRAEVREASVCRRCGHELMGEEQFCGQCGLPRSSASDPSSLQSKVASLWQMQQATKAASPNGNSVHGEDSATLDVPNNETDSEPVGFRKPRSGEEVGTTGSDAKQEIVPSAAVTFPVFPVFGDSDADSIEADSEELQSARLEVQGARGETALAKSREDITWNSAAKARAALEALAASRTPHAMGRFWNSRRGDFYLAVAVILVGVVMRWGIWSNNSVGATAGGSRSAIPGASHRGKPAPGADLSMFEKLLVSLGLAEAPEQPEYKGNPDTQVWVDLHTALYYCPGSDLYGKTEKGKLTSQRSAQLDQFEPAYRKACD